MLPGIRSVLFAVIAAVALMIGAFALVATFRVAHAVQPVRAVVHETPARVVAGSFGGVIGGLVQVLSMLLLHEGGSVLGASAGAFGVTAAYAILFPDSIIMLMFFIPMPARFLLLLEGGIAIGGVARLSMFDPHVAHAAHLGGMITGVIFVRYAVHWRLRWPQLKRPGRRPLRPLVKVHSQKPAWAQNRPDASEDLPADEFLSKKVDPILDKISAHGIQSLTERERRILEKARAKMAKR